jgi:hypothetical protein
MRGWLLVDDNVTKLPICGAKKNDGGVCERIVSAPGKTCYAHDPTRKADRRRSASTAAKSKLSAEVVAIRAETRQIMEDLREGELDRGDANVLLQGCNILLRTVDQGRRQAEYDEVRREMAELRELFENQRAMHG